MKVGDIIICKKKIQGIYYNYTKLTIGREYSVIEVYINKDIPRGIYVITDDENKKVFLKFNNFEEYFWTLREYRKIKLDKLKWNAKNMGVKFFEKYDAVKINNIDEWMEIQKYLINNGYRWNDCNSLFFIQSGNIEDIYKDILIVLNRKINKLTWRYNYPLSTISDEKYRFEVNYQKTIDASNVIRKLKLDRVHSSK